MSLFSVFDPVTLGGQFNWISLVFPFMLVGGFYYYIKGGVNIVFVKMVLVMESLFKELGGKSNGKIISFVVVGVMMYLIMSNVFGLFPFIFTHTAHPSFTLGIGMALWLVCVIMGWFKNFSMSSSHLVPEGSPLMLSFLLVIIESISHIIRPFTLSIRLAANMMAGHLIIGLVSGISYSNFFSSLVLQSMLMVLESGVALVQGIVFSILLLLYTVEYY
uniref:ATP synthase subunit a n=2 Tax=unclassified Mesabolivar TaxID=2625251 RepID=A0A411FET3_9ARAC|nr:ATP synthase F0 subunit 6 [Mesabolivar sp. ITV1036I1]YP_009554251.1 ATP synthase F0 subunit 6 [Mesabolivar sp. ITV1036I3]QBA91981.1 ATP synthase F0 subunit 6 [Mesabolivar sp. ITV1036I1]QBA92007.1 ATP synthase F0 subunit 6 [Mesabolivar sp. ITV1036I3]